MERNAGRNERSIEEDDMDISTHDVTEEEEEDRALSVSSWNSEDERQGPLATNENDGVHEYLRQMRPEVIMEDDFERMSFESDIDSIMVCCITLEAFTCAYDCRIHFGSARASIVKNSKLTQYLLKRNLFVRRRMKNVVASHDVIRNVNWYEFQLGTIDSRPV